MTIQAKPSEEALNAGVYAELRRRLITGNIAPDHELSTRSLATELGVSQTPVRDALSRLAADGAVSIRSKRRVRVPQMTADRFDDLLGCRLLLEPEAAALALPHLRPTDVARLRAIDTRLDAAIAEGDAAQYMQANYDFHFTLYKSQPRRTLTQLIETLWLQFGPFMRVVYDRVSAVTLNDAHQGAIRAIEAGDADSLRAAISQDIADGMGLIARAGIATGPAASV